MNKKRDLETQLNELYDKKAKGAQIRSRAKWIDEGEKNTKYFLSLEKTHQSHNVINELQSEREVLRQPNTPKFQLMIRLSTFQEAQFRLPKSNTLYDFFGDFSRNNEKVVFFAKKRFSSPNFALL